MPAGDAGAMAVGDLPGQPSKSLYNVDISDALCRLLGLGVHGDRGSLSEGYGGGGCWPMVVRWSACHLWCIRAAAGSGEGVTVPVAMLFRPRGVVTGIAMGWQECREDWGEGNHGGPGGQPGSYVGSSADEYGGGDKIGESIRTDVVRIADAAKCEVYVCFEGPLGAHLKQEVRDKIMKGEYVEIFSLLPLEKFNLDRVKPDDSKKEDEEKRSYRLIPRTFVNWLQAFAIMASIIGEKNPEHCSALFCYMDAIGEAHNVYGGTAWLRYDEQFRQRRAVRSSLRWDHKDISLWMRLMSSPRRPKQFLQGGPGGHLPLDCRLERSGGCAGLLTNGPLSLGVHADLSTSAPGVAAVTPYPAASREENVPGTLQTRGRTLVRVEKMRLFLNRYPDRAAARMLASGFSEGFRIPCSLTEILPIARNLKSALLNPGVVSEKLAKEVALGRMGGPYKVQPLRDLAVSLLGVVPKKEPNTFRLIHHLSFPKGGSVNDSIDPE